MSRTWSLVAVYAIAMAWVESAVVVYLRTMVNRIDPYQSPTLDVPAWLLRTEVVREAATLVMLCAVGWLAGRSRRGRLGYFLVAFGIWDCFYYVFLFVLTGWPRSVFDWDVLFLLPLPWWGPVIAPISIAALMVVGGTLVIRRDERQTGTWPGPWAWGLCSAGVLLALYVFMETALTGLLDGKDFSSLPLPTVFNWPLFLVALLLMAAPILWLGRSGRLLTWPAASR